MPAAALDLGSLSRLVADALAARVAARLQAAGFDDVREPQRAVVEGLVAGDVTVTHLAARLGVSAQAVSKTVTDLERAGYVQRGHHADDQRARPLAFTARGEELVEALRRARETVGRELSRWLGTRDTAELGRLLEHAAEHLVDAQADSRIGIRL
jgi:DNA-binding MarR family transcriptional regulator